MKKLALFIFLTAFAASAVFGASARENRSDRFMFVGYTPVGIHLATLFAPPLSLGVILGEDLEFGVEYGSWSDSDTDDDVLFDGDFTNAGAFLRWFPGTNSFYLSLSAHQRDWTVSATSTLTDGTPYGATLKADATVVGIGVGNQWMFDFGLFIGVDWFVLSAPVARKKTVTILNEGSFSQQQKNEIEQDLNNTGDFLVEVSGFPGAVILTVGWAF